MESITTLIELRPRPQVQQLLAPVWKRQSRRLDQVSVTMSTVSSEVSNAVTFAFSASFVFAFAVPGIPLTMSRSLILRQDC